MPEFLSEPDLEQTTILSDLDGCLVSGESVLPGAVELAHRCHERLWVVSNNSSDTPQTLAARLTAMGLPIPAERIVLAGEQALCRIAVEQPGARIALFAAEPLQRLACELGLEPHRGERNADLVLLARDPNFCLEDLTRLVRLVHAGVPIQIANADPFHPAVDGSPIPETGALFAAVREIFPAVVTRSIGKPAPDMLLTALSRAAVRPDQAVFIGDTPATDGAAAHAAGVRFVLLRRPGVASPITPSSL